MKSSFALEVVARADWGTGPFDLPGVLEDYPMFAEMSAEQMRKIHAPTRIRLGSKGDLNVLADGSLRTSSGSGAFVLHFDAEGALQVKIPLHRDDLGDSDEVIILDYAVDADTNCYLLEHVRSPNANRSSNRLRMVTKEGLVRWSRVGPTSEQEFDFEQLKGSFHRLLIDGNSRLYLPATRHAGAIAEIERDTGAVAKVYTSEEFSDKLFMDERGRVTYILYFPDLNLRGLGLFDLQESELTTMVGDGRLYGWLLYPIGVDVSADLYAWKESSVARISLDGRISPIAEFDNIVVRSNDQAVLSSLLRTDAEKAVVVQVNRRSPGGGPARLDLRLPQELSGGSAWKLIHVDEQEQHYVYGGEQPGRAGMLLVYQTDGTLKETISPPGDLLPLESRLANYSFWQVDSLGRIYLPVTDGHGLRVVRLIPSSG